MAVRARVEAAITKAATVLRLDNGCLQPAEPTAREALALAMAVANAPRGALLAGAAHDELPSGPTIALLDPAAGPGMIATVLPLERGARRALMRPFAATCAVFVQDPAVVPLLPGEAFARLYGLTGGELRMALALALGQGLTTQEAADMLGIGLATVRTHLQNLYTKTGTARLPELIRLMLVSAPPLAVPCPSG